MEMPRLKVLGTGPTILQIPIRLERHANSKIVESLGELKNLVLQQPDCIVILGHGIEEVEANGKKVWRPSRLIQGLDENGWRTGVRDLNLNPDDEAASRGGGNAVTLAASQLFEDTNEIGRPPKLIVFAAGRSAYLERDPDPTLNEGRVMKALFMRKTGFEKIGNRSDIVILDKNMNTHDDIANSLRLAFDKELRSVAFIMLDIKIARAQAFLDKIIEKSSKYLSLDIKFVPAEILLEERYMGHPFSMKEFTEIMKRFKQSKVYAATVEGESGGIAAILEGDYKGRGQW